MQVHYLEIVTQDVDAVCQAYADSLGTTFGEPVAVLGNARTAPLPDGGMIGVRTPLSDTETPLVRPYWLVADIESALGKAVAGGAEMLHPPLELPAYGRFAIYALGGVQHGLWQR